MTKQQIENIDMEALYFETEENCIICAVCSSGFDNLEEAKKHLNEQGFIV